MATKIRKDPRGRILRKGEGFRPDKNTYIFQYMDPLGRHHTIYAKDIVELRKKEDSMEKDRLDGIRTYIAGETTLNYAFDRYLALKYDLKPSTKTNYLYIYEHFVRKRIGKKLIKDLRYSDIRRYYNQLIVKEGVSPSTVENIHTLINPVLSMAVRDGIIRNNPADGLMKEMKRSSLWRKGERHPLSIEESTAFLNYVESSPIYNHWLTLFVVFFGTGMRVSEVCGLRWEDIDFDKNLQRTVRLTDSIPPNSKAFRKHAAEEKERNRRAGSSCRVPLIGTVAAGQPILAFDDYQDGYELPKELLRSAEPSETIMLTVDGESMIEAGMYTGDMIIVTRSFEVRDGDIVVARINGDTATVKRFYDENGHIRLQPENSTMDPIIVKRSEVEIVGKVIGLIRSY